MKRLGSFVSHIGRRTFWQLWWLFFTVFAICAAFFAALYWILGQYWPNLFFTSQGKLCWTQAFYVSFATQLTIGAGNLALDGWYQPIVIVQSIVGVALFGVWSGLAVTSFLTAHPRTIRFAKWAGYDLSREKFFVLFVNQNVENLVDVSITGIVKLAGFNPVRSAINPPYIGRSVWSFGFERVPIRRLASTELIPGDGIKFGISGKAGNASFTSWHRYELSDIYVQNDRDYANDEQFTDPKFDAEFEEAFESRKPGAVHLKDFDFHRYWTEILSLANWMNDILANTGHVRRDRILPEVRRHFSEGYIHADAAADRQALADFLALTEGKIVMEFRDLAQEAVEWLEDEQLWRKRERSGSPDS